MYNVVEFRRDEYAGWYVALKRDEDQKIYWAEVWVDEKYQDVEANWNQYIFHVSDEDDMHRKTVQENTDEFDMAMSEAICHLVMEGELLQDNDGYWKCNIRKECW